VLPFVDGSAQLEQGNTSVIASVCGPREPAQRSDLQVDRCTISVDFSFVRAQRVACAAPA
jgi:ribonuclease PH